MRRRAVGRDAPPVLPGATPPAPLSSPRRGLLSIDPEDWAWLHDLIRRRGESRR